MVQRVVETTEGVAAYERWDYWKETALAAVDAKSVCDPADFAAFRTVTHTATATLIQTASAPMSMTRTRRKIAGDGMDHACLVVALAGSGVIDQNDKSSEILRTGDVKLYDLGRPYTGASFEPYRELRLYVPRDVFARRVGRIETLSGLQLARGSGLVDMFTNYFTAYAANLASLTDRDVEIGMDGVIHLIAGLVQSSLQRADDRGATVAKETLRALALRHIEALLADPALDVAALARVIGVSRTRLYGAFEDDGGVASALRDARLDRARLLLQAPQSAHRTLEEIARRTGFVEYATFARAFRRRFGLSPRDAKEAGAAGDAR